MRKTIIAILTLAVLAAMLAGCQGDPLDYLYTENIYNSSALETGSIEYTEDCWEEITVTADGMGTLVGEAPTESNCQSGFVYLMANYALVGDEPYVHFSVQLPHNYKEGTDIIFSVRFVFDADEVGTYVRWAIGYSWANIGDAFPVVSHIWALSDPSNNDNTVHQVTKFAAIDGTGKEMGSIVMCYLKRNSSDASDTYMGTAILIAVSVLYQVDSAGSASEWSK